MSQSTITFRWYVDDVLTDLDAAPTLRDPTGTYGVKRDDTDAVVVAAEAAFTRQSTGLYTYTFTDPAPNLDYTYYVRYVFETAVFEEEGTLVGGGGDVTLNSYLSVADADAIADELLSVEVASYAAASSADKAKALARASRNVDRAMRYQGRRYAADQVLEFPRVAYGGTGYQPVSAFDEALAAAGYAEEIWDLDDDGEAVVPVDVKTAVVHEANSILAGRRRHRQDARHEGINAHSADGLSESFAGPAPVVCREAMELLRQYELRTGELL